MAIYYSDEELALKVAASLNLTIYDGNAAATGAEWELVAQGRLDEAELVELYARITDLEIADEEEFEELQPYPEITFDYLSNAGIVPLQWTKESVKLAVSSPYGLGMIQTQWQSMFAQEVTFILARRTVIERALSFFYMSHDEESGLLTVDGDASEQTLRDMAKEAPIVRLVTETFNRAVEMGASDIHIEPGEMEASIRYRIDGVLQTVQTAPSKQYPAIASRVKLLAGMNIAERRLPQDGRIDQKAKHTQLDVRASTVPTMHGESIVLRLLQKNADLFDLAKVGLPEELRLKFEEVIKMPHGMLLSVGPTGSGKTTTLYCVLKILNSDTRKIITIEDPVEYQIDGVSQIQVHPQIGLTFANGLRAIVRQDPDVVLVGEIRDRETAEIAIHAALTGHLVLSTLHTNDAAGAISRLIEMGVESFLISSALLGVLSQRLVRKICPECQGEGVVPQTEAKRCKNCSGSGYKGRTGIFEFLLMNDELRKAVNAQKDSSEIGAIARKYGMKNLRECGKDKVKAGVTTAAEVTRVCQVDLVS